MNLLKFFIPAIIALLITKVATAQIDTLQTKPTQYVKELVKIPIPVLGAVREKPVGKQSTLLIGGGFGYQIGWGGHKVYADQPDFRYRINPAFGVGYRYYYNFEKRLAKGKNIDNNSANFIAASLGLSLPDILVSKYMEKNKNVSTGISTTWGLQRRLGNRFNFELELGVGVGTDFKTFKVNPAGGIGFSYLIKK